MIGTVAWKMDPVLTLISLAVAPIMAGSSLVYAPRIKKRARLNIEARYLDLEEADFDGLSTTIGIIIGL